MIIIILLLILAVLLFGSSAVIGAAGYLLGYLIAGIALIYAANVFNLDIVMTAIIGLVGFFALCGLVMLVAKIIEPYETAWIEKRMDDRKK